MTPAGGTRWVSTGALVAIVVSFAGLAEAVSPEAAALFREGRDLLARGEHAAACQRLADSFALEPSSGTLLNLALCHERQGKTASAWVEYRRAAELAHAQGRTDRAHVAAQRAAVLEPRVARVTVTTPKPIAGLVIAGTSGPLGTGTPGVPIPVDPGRMDLVISAPGHLPWKQAVTIAEAEQSIVEVPVLAPEPSAPEPLVPEPTLNKLTTGALSSRSQPKRFAHDEVPAGVEKPGWSVLDISLAGTGAALVLTGATLWFADYARLQKEQAWCTTSGCLDAPERRAAVRERELIAWGAGVTGGALLVASGLHYWFHNRRMPWTMFVASNGAASLTYSGGF